ncbi:unnamed protein product [Bemisia tabaci]|uniref:Phorbol-ester/DAG-type domain-containing protein n=1 Tax=Bemisia tabaci TaxID=7038 RepID=A0A9P0EY95_BEMTA|nr:unnamed protein product [Bemisia tabaci]
MTELDKSASTSQLNESSSEAGSDPAFLSKSLSLPASYVDRIPKYLSSAVVIINGNVSAQDKENPGSVDSELVTPTSSVSESDESNGRGSPPPPGHINSQNYLTFTESSDALLSITELTEVISSCQESILKSEECSEERRWLVRRLIELRYRLAVAKETLNQENQSPISETRVLRGHHFSLQKRSVATAKAMKFCERCCRAIWTVLVSWYECLDCGYECHIKCIENTVRICANVKRAEKPQYETNICPETNLAEQNYKCAECKSTINFRSTWQEPRLCDYAGKYYCPLCHWNTMMVSPARVIHNWDFNAYPVCRASYQLLTLKLHKPLISLEKLNPRLFGLLDELGRIKKLREDILVLKRYLITCRIALEKNLAWKFCQKRRYFLEDADRYSLQDLIDIKNGALESILEGIHNNLTKHVKVDCEICRGRGYRCELCDNKTIIFPFDSGIDTCSKCKTAYHHKCWHGARECRKCERIRKWSVVSVDSDDS